MLPSILTKQLQKGIGDYIETTFPMTNELFKGSVQKLLATKDSVYHKAWFLEFSEDIMSDDGRLLHGNVLMRHSFCKQLSILRAATIIKLPRSQRNFRFTTRS